MDRKETPSALSRISRELIIPSGHSFELVESEALQMELRSMNSYLSNLPVDRFHVNTFPSTQQLKAQFNGSSVSGSGLLLKMLVSKEIIPSFLEKFSVTRNSPAARFVSSDGLLAFRALGWVMDEMYSNLAHKEAADFQNPHFAELIEHSKDVLGEDPLAQVIKYPVE